MSVAFLCRLEIVENRFGAGFATRREQPARCLNEVAGPNQMIPAEIVVSLRRTPGDGEAGDNSAGRIVAMAGQNGGAHAITIQTVVIAGLIEGHKGLLPFLPLGTIALQHPGKSPLQAQKRSQRGRFRKDAKPDCQDGASAAGAEIKRARECDVALFGTVKLWFQ